MVGMQVARKDVKSVKYSLNGKAFGVRVADIGSELNQEILNIRQNYGLGRNNKNLLY
jgi:hypothetical protein